MSDVDWKRVADAIRNRMDVLYLTQSAMQERAKVSPVTLRKLLRPEWAAAEPPRRETMVGVSSALGWGPNGLWRIGEGEDAAVVEADVERDNAPKDADMLPIMRRIEGKLDELLAAVTSSASAPS